MSHIPVMLAETLAGLAIEPSGIYIDGTFGRGGHSRAILQALNSEGRLLVIDKDPTAIAVAKQLAADDSRVSWHHGSFTEMQHVVADKGWTNKVSGILVDLGVSSPQLDEATRGFSFLQNGPLDMRMNTEAGQTAADYIATVPEKDLADILFQYGDERYSRRIAKAIVQARQAAPITTTLQLAEIIKEAHPKWPKQQHPATRSFQAIRIHINDELADVSSFLPQSLAILKPSGRLVVITFHSLEDRLVKQFVQERQHDPRFPKDMAVQASQYHVPVRFVGKKYRASAAELSENPRSRSACVRVMEKQ